MRHFKRTFIEVNKANFESLTLGYLIYNRCLCEFTHDLTNSFKITCKKAIFNKLDKTAGNKVLENMGWDDSTTTFF